MSDFHIDQAALQRVAEQGVKDKIEGPLNRVAAHLATEMAGQPVDVVLAELRRRVARDVPALRDPNVEVLRKIAERIAGEPS